MERNEGKQKRERRIMENENRCEELCDSIKYNNISIIGAPEEEDREMRAENLFEEIIAEKFSNLRKETDI